MDQEPEESNYINDSKTINEVTLLKNVKKNTILYIPTGKTYITTLIIKEKGETLNKSLGERKKWTFLIFNNEHFIDEQVDYLRSHLPWNIVAVSDNMNVNSWSQEQWDELLEKFHIIVLTGQIYLNNLLHGFMNIKDANLVIFDECHHAVSPHPFKEIMQVFHDTNFENNDYPHIVGLTTTLINPNTKNVKEELVKLQQTFNATIKSKYEEDVQIISEHPEDCVHLYDEHILDKQLLNVINRIKIFIDNEVAYQILDYNNPIENNYYFEYQKPSKIVKNYFMDLMENLVENGAYVAFIAAWYFMIEIEQHKKQCQDGINNHKYLILSTVLSELTTIRKMLQDYMNTDSSNIESPSSLFENDSPKLRELMKIFSSINRNDNCLVFVNNQRTATFLYHYIQDYTRAHDQTNIACDFIVEIKKKSMTESKEMIYKKYLNDEIIKKFNKQVINVLITTDILEDGIDFKNCKYVIRYDTPKSLLFYIQSKRRAYSKFIILMPVQFESQFKRIHSEYIEMEEEINKVLIRNIVSDESKEEYEGEVFKTEYQNVTHKEAIPIIDRYCRSLPHDNFTNLSPKWYVKYSCSFYNKYIIQLPINSVFPIPIDGNAYRHKISAIKSAAVKACFELYMSKALDDNMMPVKSIDKSAYTDSVWFPYWEEEDIEAKKYKQITGNSQMKRLYHIKTPSYLYQTYPQVKESSYLHVIHCVPKYSQLQDPSNEIFDELLKSNKEFGILTSKKLPHVSEFPIFLHFGDVNVHIKVNVDIIRLDPEHYEKLEKFHNKLFLDLLDVKDFVIRDYNNENNSYLIIPVYYSDNIYNVDWDVVDIDNFVETEVVPTMEQRNSKYYESYLNKYNVVSPWYRNTIPIQRYVVIDVYSDMTPESAFPSNDFDSYETYFIDKYNIKVVNKNQPMIKTKSMDITKIDYLVPTFTSCKYAKKLSKFVELLIPEFCTWHKFPSNYWLKALMLPTILYRFHQLLLAEELLIKCNSLCNVNVRRNSNINDTLEMDKFCGFLKPQKKTIILPLGETLKFMDNSQLDFNDKLNLNSFPIDIERQQNIKLLNILNYHTFFNAEQSKSDENNQIGEEEILNNMFIDLNISNVSPPVLSPLYFQNLNKKIGPKQSDILKVITSKFASDMFNNVRLYLFGDSLIRFAISLVLFDIYQSENEGFLIELRMKMSSSQNLFYVGKKQNLGSYLMVNTFEPLMDWTPPCFTIPQKLKEIIEEDSSKSDVLHSIVIPKDEKYSGNLSDETLHHIDTQIEIFMINHKMMIPVSTFDNNDDLDVKDDANNLQITHSLSNLFVHKQSVSDKMVVICLKSLIGAYGYHSGVDSGFNVLGNLGIIPKELIDVYKFNLNKCHDSVQSLNFSLILPGYEILEQRINYSFKNKLLLVEALTHPSYQFKHSECYQRQQFLGDSILDFLITSYIVDHCNDKTINEIKDIKSSLVNNITFASLSIRIGLHRFILANSIETNEAIDRFYKYQHKNNHKIGQDVLLLMEESECLITENVEVPKVLSDLFRSIIGAIYLDCDRDLNLVWSICYSFMENEIKGFCTNTPKNLIRILHETQLKPIFSMPVPSSHDFGITIQLEIIIHDTKEIFFGCGKNKKEAKLAAAKMALRSLKKMIIK